MANSNAVDLLRAGHEQWNDIELRRELGLQSAKEYDFSGADLKGILLENFVFDKSANFNGCTIDGANLSINSTREGNDISFVGATFTNPVRLVIFGNRTYDFTEAVFEDSVHVLMAHSHNRMIFNRTVFRASFSAEETFGAEVSFVASTFHGAASFRRVRFENETNFTDAIFHVAPNFQYAELYRGVLFSTGPAFERQFLDVTSPYAEKSYQRLKWLMHDHQALSEELAFGKLELRARALKEPLRRRWLYDAYGMFSDLAAQYGGPARRY